jgi:hypothetical protein
VPHDPFSVPLRGAADHRAEGYLRGVDDYRAGRYFEAHERWEELWLVEPEPARKRLLQALIQIAAAMHKLHRQGQRGAAIRLLARARAKLPESPGAAGLLGAEVDRARAALDAAEASGASDPTGGLPAALVPPIGADLVIFGPEGG